MPPDLSSNFANDRPLGSDEPDRLNRDPFAKRITQVLLGLPAGERLVIGIHGPWGDGKTTVLNRIRDHVNASKNAVAIEFNPWRFTDESQMLRDFFFVLAGAVRKNLTTKKEEIAKNIERIGRYLSVVTDRAEAAAKIAEENAAVGLEDLRYRLSEALTSAEKRIVILVDDIDRLDKHETYTLFRLIKACADFPNLSYVLAFDDVAVARALGERYGGGDEAAGRAFLEKIVQVPLKLPLADKEDLRELCFEQVFHALQSAGIELTPEQLRDFTDTFDAGVSAQLTTPRLAKRYGNAILFALPMLMAEVDPVDLLLVEALRAFFPAVYSEVRDFQPAFLGTDLEPFPRPSIAEGHPAYGLLLRLFPNNYLLPRPKPFVASTKGASPICVG